MTENSIQEEFLSTVSHELRTPLTSIRGFSQTLLNSWDRISDDDKQKFIKIIEEQSNRLINLVENILSVSKINSEKQVLKKVDINANISKIVTLIANQHKNHRFVTNLYTNLPPARLDEDKFQQIMTNLLDNAAKYSEQGNEVIVSTAVVNNKISVKVKDFGIGIKQEDYPKMFKKFSRLENYLTGKTQGNGLGLYITKQLTEQMGGTIDFESEYNKGTVFELSFPFYDDEVVLRCLQTS
ncbi:MAG: HAMP domain-containing histidine kinase [bacterium]|nr:HAMP domain-containing histidine kinase [bacterium]